jgi:hypothetical protein
MMGTKVGTFAHLPEDLSLEDLLPEGALLPPTGGSAGSLVFVRSDYELSPTDPITPP